jgi:hypothetical protein
VIWVTHHDLRFPDYEAGRFTLKELAGIDLVVNGHIHTPKPPQQCGGTLWVNPGGISRVSRSVYTQKMQPAISLWHPERPVPERLIIPHRPFEEIFPPFTPEEDLRHDALDESRFIKGLENLMIRKTTEGVGLKSFLEANLDPDSPLNTMIWELYEEVMNAETQE